jgi:hypothetical protein
MGKSILASWFACQRSQVSLMLLSDTLCCLDAEVGCHNRFCSKCRILRAFHGVEILQLRLLTQLAQGREAVRRFKGSPIYIKRSG